MLKVLNNYSLKLLPTRNSKSSLLQSSSALVQFKFLCTSNDTFFPNIECQLCNIKGHYQTHFPVATNNEGASIYPPNQETQNISTTKEVSNNQLKEIV